MPFERTAPQIASHSDGYVVRTLDRYHMEYQDGPKVARITADLEGPRVLLFRETVEWTAPLHQSPTREEADLILARVEAGLAALGDLSEIVG